MLSTSFEALKKKTYKMQMTKMAVNFCILPNTSQLQIILHVFKCIMPTQLVFLIYLILAHLEGTVSINHHLNRRFFLVNNPKKINTNDISYMRRSTMSLNVCMMCLKLSEPNTFSFGSLQRFTTWNVGFVFLALLWSMY